MKRTTRQLARTIAVWSAVQFLIILFSLLLWNLILPGLGLPGINLLQMTGLYALIKILNFDWVKKSYENSNLKIKK